MSSDKYRVRAYQWRAEIELGALVIKMQGDTDYELA